MILFYKDYRIVQLTVVASPGFTVHARTLPPSRSRCRVSNCVTNPSGGSLRDTRAAVRVAAVGYARRRLPHYHWRDRLHPTCVGGESHGMDPIVVAFAFNYVMHAAATIANVVDSDVVQL